MIHQCEKCGAEFPDLQAYVNHFPACNRKFKLMGLPDVSIRLNKIANLAQVLSEALSIQENAYLKKGACWILGDIEDLAYEITEVLYGKQGVQNECKNETA